MSTQYSFLKAKRVNELRVLDYNNMDKYVSRLGADVKEYMGFKIIKEEYSENTILEYIWWTNGCGMINGMDEIIREHCIGGQYDMFWEIMKVGFRNILLECNRLKEDKAKWF